MSTLIILVHVVVCFALIFVVLLQTGKGSDMGAAFGGGSSQTLFGSTGASTFLSKMTTGAAIVFMLTSLTLAYVSSRKMGGSSIVPDTAPVPVAQEAEQALPDNMGTQMPNMPADAPQVPDALPDPKASAPVPAETKGDAAPAASADQG